MFLADFLVTFVFALLLTTIFAVWIGRTRAITDLILFFGVIFLGGWAAAVWIASGPVLFEVSWLPMLTTGVLIAILFLALVPPYADNARPMNRVEAAKARHEARQSIESLSMFMWLFYGSLLLIVLLGYLA